MTKYLFKSQRLGFRNWNTTDLPDLIELCQNEEVMKHFPTTLTDKECEHFLGRLIKHFNTHGYNYYATEVLETGELIGFIGLAYQAYETDFTPATDIGWRLKRSAWGQGYATEGAKRCLEFAFDDLKLEKVISVCTIKNTDSESVMKKIGMVKLGEFDHPNLLDYPDMLRCFHYQIIAEDCQ